MSRRRVTAAAIYARISRDDGSALGVTRQLEDCRKLAAELGWEVAEEYVDNDVSAYSGKRRPAYEAMVEDIAAGERDAVIVYHQDRLHRRPIESEQFVEVMQAAGVRYLRFAAGGEADLTNGDGLFLLRVQSAVAANESDAKSRRVRRKMQELAEAGAPHGGLRPFGYQADKVTIEPAEAEVVRQLAERFLAGESLISLTRWLNDEGVPTAGKASEWRTSSVRQMLRSVRISGQREHQGEIHRAQWPAIITPAQTERIRAILDDPSRRTNRTARRYLLAGMLRCSKCERPLFAHPRAGVRRYVCKSGPDFGGCGGTYIDAARAEELIAEAVLYRLDTPALADALAGRQRQDSDTAALSEQVEADEAQLDELAALYADRSISAKEWLAARKSIETRLDEAKRRLARKTSTVDIAQYMGQGEALRTKWSTLNLDRQRAVVASIFDHAVVHPPTIRQFDPDRVRPVWRL